MSLSLFASSLILALNPSFLAIDPSLVEKKLQGSEVYIGNSTYLQGERRHPRYLPKNGIYQQPINKNTIRDGGSTTL